MLEVSQQLRRAIENLVDAKLLDVLGKPGGLDRLIAHRRTGVASYDIRQAEKKLDEAVNAVLTHAEKEISPATVGVAVGEGAM